MDEKFEFHFNNYNESNVNRPCAQWPDGDNAMSEWVNSYPRQRTQLTGERIADDIVVALQIALAARGDSPDGAGARAMQKLSGSGAVAHGLASPTVC
jgi:hypothetical protein